MGGEERRPKTFRTIRDMPPELRGEIRRFVRQNLRKVPVTGGGPTPDGGYVKNMAELIEERWGVRLTPGQIYRLARGEPRSVRLPREMVRYLEEEFGDASKGLKELVPVLRHMLQKPPAHLRPAIQRLGGRELDYDDAVRELKDAGYENPDEVLRELGRLGYLENREGRLRFHRFRRPPEHALMGFFSGLGR